MFLRLQNGSVLNAQEKRNAMSGQMRTFIKDIADHPFFTICPFSDKRFIHHTVAAQMTAIEISGGPCSIQKSILDAMYRYHRDFTATGNKAKKIQRVLNFLFDAFQEKTPELSRYSVISLYALVSHCLDTYVFPGRGADLRKWFIAFEAERVRQRTLPTEARDPELLMYKNRTGNSTDAEDSIRWRHEFLLRKFFEAVPDIVFKDPQRLFSPEQRLVIYRRDEGVCKLRLKCNGTKCDWNGWEADHVIAWTHGGTTTVENGRVACPACNAAKGAAKYGVD